MREWIRKTKGKYERWYEYNEQDGFTGKIKVKIEVKRKATNFLARQYKDYYTGVVKIGRKSVRTEEFGLLKECKKATEELYMKLLNEEFKAHHTELNLM